MKPISRLSAVLLSQAMFHTRVRVDAFSNYYCTDTETSNTENALLSYSTAGCDPNACTSDCYAAYSNLYYSLPDCVYSDNTNYYELASTLVTACYSSMSTTTTDTTDTTTDTTGDTTGDTTTDTTGGATCSDSEMSSTYSIWNSYNTAGCDTSACTSYCYNTYSTLYSNLPNCVYADGNNYDQIALNLATACYSTLGGTSSTGSPSSGSKGVHGAVMAAFGAALVLW